MSRTPVCAQTSNGHQTYPQLSVPQQAGFGGVHAPRTWGIVPRSLSAGPEKHPKSVENSPCFRGKLFKTGENSIGGPRHHYYILWDERNAYIDATGRQTPGLSSPGSIHRWEMAQSIRSGGSPASQLRDVVHVRDYPHNPPPYYHDYPLHSITQ